MVVFLNAIAPLSVVAKEFSASDELAAEALFGNRIIICTPIGFKYISIDELHNRQNKGEEEQQSQCMLCQINVSAAILAAVDLSSQFEIEFFNTTRQIYVTDFLQKPTILFNASNPRAPPPFL